MSKAITDAYIQEAHRYKNLQAKTMAVIWDSLCQEVIEEHKTGQISFMEVGSCMLEIAKILGAQDE